MRIRCARLRYSHPHSFKSGQRSKRPQSPESSERFDWSQVREAHQTCSQTDQGNLRRNHNISFSSVTTAFARHVTAGFVHVETHVDDEEVQPAPGVGEVGLEAVGHPFQHHLDDKDEGENFVGKLQDDFDGSLPFDVYVFKGLQEESTEDAYASSGTSVLKEDNLGCRITHQGSAAEEDHKNDEGLKPVVLYDSEAGPAEVPPLLSFTLADVHIQTRPALHTI